MLGDVRSAAGTSGRWRLSMVGARFGRRGLGHGLLLVGALITVVLGASSAQLTRPADASAQVLPRDCTGNTIYQLQRLSTGSTSGRINTVAVGSMSGTNPVTATEVSNPIAAGNANALGISEGAAAAWALGPQQPGGANNTLIFTLHSLDPATGVWTPHTATIDTAGRLPSGVTAANIRSGGIVAGAVDPHSGNFFWAYLANAPQNAMTIFGFNTTTNQPIGVVANSNLPQTLPASGSTNGDIAFDGAGNLFVVSNTGTHAAVGVIDGPLPTTQEASTPTRANTRLTTFSNTDNNSYNGIAFNGVGELFIQWSSSTTTTTIRKISPQNGQSIAGPSTVNPSPAGGGIGVDLGGCATPPTLELRKNVTARQADTDQFHLAIEGGALTTANTATTTGTATGVQRQTAGPVVAQAGTTYTFTETGAGTTILANYGAAEWRCVDQAADNVEVASGTGRSFTFAPAAGQAILCTFTNTFPAGPGIDVDKTGRLDTGADGVPNVGDTIHYTITVRNTGNVTLRDVTVTERDLAAMSAIACGGGTNVIATLGEGESVECTATHALTQADIDRGYVPNFATATGTPPQGPDIEDGDSETVPITARPALEVDKTGELHTGSNGVTNLGDTIDYTITVRNTGNVTLRNVTVAEQNLAGLSPIDCGGGTGVIATLGVGASVRCTATHTVTQADLDAGFVPNFAIATGTPVIPGAPAEVADVEDGDNDIEPIAAAIALQKTATPSVVARGSTVRFVLRVANRSEVAARDVRVCDRPPRGLTVASAPGFRVRGRTVCRSIGTLQPGNRRTVAFTARVGAGAPSRMTNTATATSTNAQSVHARARVSIVGTRPPRVTG
jgi:uncharacterized repeat protein (TIGR01451 family)